MVGIPKAGFEVSALFDELRGLTGLTGLRGRESRGRCDEVVDKVLEH